MKTIATSRKFSLLLVIVVLLGSGFLAARMTDAHPSKSGKSDQRSLYLKDGKDEDESNDDSSGHGGDDRHDDSSGHGEGDDDDRSDGDVARPTIPVAELGDVVIEIIDEAFVPSRAELKTGQSVTFVNLDDDNHTATGIGFDTGTLTPGSWKTVTLMKSGVAPFTCQFHPEMLGELEVIGEGTPVSASPIAASPVALESTPAVAQVTVNIADFAFETPKLVVAAGTEITWVNTGVAPHTVTGSFGDSGVIQPGDSFSFVVNERGTFDYVCQFHPQMTASIVVT